jgi:hypothetical protein
VASDSDFGRLTEGTLDLSGTLIVDEGRGTVGFGGAVAEDF